MIVAQTTTTDGTSIGSLLFVGPYPPVLGGTAAMLARLIPSLEETGVSCRILNTGVGNPNGGIAERVKRLFRFVGIAVRIAAASETIVHCHAVNYANLIGHGVVLLACRLCGKHTVLTLHAGDLQERFGGGRSRTLSRVILGMADVITSVTPDLADTVREMGLAHTVFIANGLRYVPEGFDLPSDDLPVQISQFIDSHSPIAILVGGLSPVYGIDIFLRAVAELKKNQPNIGAIIVAFKSDNPQYRTALDEIVAQCELEHHTLFPEPFSQIAACLRQSDVFVRPSRSDGDSIAIREALAIGLPVVASSVGYRPAGVTVFRTEDHRDLADSLMAALSKAHTTSFDPMASEKATVSKYISVYKQAIGLSRGQ